MAHSSFLLTYFYVFFLQIKLTKLKYSLYDRLSYPRDDFLIFVSELLCLVFYFKVVLVGNAAP